jgi:cell division protein ZapE
VTWVPPRRRGPGHPQRLRWVLVSRTTTDSGDSGDSTGPISSGVPDVPAATDAGPASLTARAPRVPAERLLAELAPPPRFATVGFDTYVSDPNQPSQAEAVRALRAFAGMLTAGGTPDRRTAGGWWRRRLGRPHPPAGASEPRGMYLDGGYGVGKTHLLASLWHATPAAPERKAFCTFVELTNLVGALGFQPTVQAFSGHRLVCIDEFELDDPGDTVLISTLLGKLVDAGVALAATSNTLPGKLGEGRFAAADFLREIQGLSARFRPLRIDGEDYRHRGLPKAPPPHSDEVVAGVARRTPGASLDDFPSLLAHLSTVHPSRYGALCDGLRAVCLTGLTPVPDQSTALRLVVLADRLYDREVPVLASGVPFDRLFSEEMLQGGYRKKYFRAISRLTALARDARQLLDA